MSICKLWLLVIQFSNICYHPSMCFFPFAWSYMNQRMALTTNSLYWHQSGRNFLIQPWKWDYWQNAELCTFKIHVAHEVTYFLCGHSITPGDVGAVGYPVVGVCSEAPRVICTVRVTAVVLSQVSTIYTQTTFQMMVLMTAVLESVFHFKELGISTVKMHK